MESLAFGIPYGIKWSSLIAGLFGIGAIVLLFRFRLWQFARYKQESSWSFNQWVGFSAATSASLSIGGIIGVAAAILVGGPGAVFWMWIAGIGAIIYRFCEGLLYDPSTHTNSSSPKENKFKKALLLASSLLSVFTGIGIGCFYLPGINAGLVQSEFGISGLWVGVGILIPVVFLIFNQKRTINLLFGWLNPILIALFIAIATLVCLSNITRLGSTLAIIFTDAFSGLSVAGGLIGIVILAGVSQGILTGQGGFGTSSRLANKFSELSPIQRGLFGGLEPVITIFIIGTLTAILIISNGMFGPNAYQKEAISTQTEKPPVYLGSGWKHLNTLPFSESKLRHPSATAPESIYLFQPVADSIGILEVRNITQLNRHLLTSEGIRFSSWSHDVKIEVRLLDIHSNLVAAAYIPSQTDHPLPIPLSFNDVEVGSITPITSDSQWQSILVKFNKSALSSLLLAKESETLSIQLVGYGASGSQWSVHSVETVRPQSSPQLVVSAIQNRLGKWGKTVALMTLAGLLICGSVAWCLITVNATQSIVVSPRNWLKILPIGYGAIALLGSVWVSISVLKAIMILSSLLLIPTTLLLIQSTYDKKTE